jgi:hypothetical protein
METKSVFAISNGSQTYFPKNTLTNFRNKFPNDIITNENYELSVESIGFSKNFKQIHLPDDGFPSFFISKSDIISYVKTPNTEKKELKNQRIKILQTELDDLSLDEFKTNKNDIIEVDYENLKLRKKRSTQVNNNDFKTFPFYFRDGEKYSKSSLKEYFQKVKKITGVNVNYIDTEDKIVFNIPTPKNTLESPTTTFDSYFVVMHDTFASSFVVNDYCFVTIPYDEFYWQPMPENNSVHRTNRDDGEITLKIKLDMTDVYYINEKYKSSHIQSYRHTLICENVAKINFPNLVKLKCGNIKSQIMNNSYSNDLVVFCPDFEKKDNFFYHEFDSLQFIPLSNIILRDIELSLCDENNRFLQLEAGTPTIVKLSLQKMDVTKDSFNVRLTSSPSVQNPNNTSSSFKVILPTTLNLDRKWRVALTAISHPNEFNTFLKEEDSRSMAITWKNNDSDKNVNVRKLVLREYYDNAGDIVNEINNFLKLSNMGFAKTEEEKLTFTFDRNCILVIGNYLLRILGFTYMDDISHYKKYTVFPIRFNSTKDYIKSEEKIEFCFQDVISLNLLDAKYICMYANFISPTILAGEYHKLLRIIPIRESKTGYVISEFKHKDFYELQNTEIKEIEIELRAHDGELINFKSKQNIILNLLFSNYIDKGF